MDAGDRLPMDVLVCDFGGGFLAGVRIPQLQGEVAAQADSRIHGIVA